MRINLLAFSLILAVAPTPASALLCGTFLDPMKVNITALAFGNYFPISQNTSSVTVAISCGLLGADLLPAFTVSLSSGNASNPSARYMNNGSTHLNYNVYTTSGYSKVWGDGSSSSITQSYSGLLSLGTINFTGYGKLPSGQYVTPGPYSDLVTVTVAY